MNLVVIRLILGVLVWLAVAGRTQAAAIDDDDLLKEANSLLGQYKDSEALEKFKLVLLDNPDHYEALYKASLLNSRIGGRYIDETEKLQYFTSAKVYAESALQVQPNGADSHYAMALAINNLSMVSGAKDRLMSLAIIKEHLDKALRANPEHAAAWQLLGRWYYKAANLNLLETTASKFLTGSAPVGASNYRAIEALQKSITINPLNISGLYDLAIIYHDINQTRQSIQVLQEALKLNLLTSEDLEISRRCKAMLQQIGGDMIIKTTSTSTESARI
ncbi:MAG: hypothetical protein COW65_13185 [Cytophagales bacterium CG18_big_fil_WC_8_21_14_2_50_42_9]|nr:MAG: hypothetical protein COW65_13185 [Cytophagales bacterium CG18_big_fil_WC_8_21_14_2_50_42_9]